MTSISSVIGWPILPSRSWRRSFYEPFQAVHILWSGTLLNTIVCLLLMPGTKGKSLEKFENLVEETPREMFRSAIKILGDSA